MSTIRKTISISSKDRKLQEIIENVPSYEVSHVIRQLMYDGLKYRHLVEQGMVNDINVQIIPQKPLKSEEIEEKPLKREENKQKEPKNEENKQKTYNFDEFDEEFDINEVKLEEIEENDEDLEDLLLNNG